jgi:hypothetical protein
MRARLVNGQTVSQTLNFQFDVFTRSASCETAVRLGAQSGTTTGCDTLGAALPDVGSTTASPSAPP